MQKERMIAVGMKHNIDPTHNYSPMPYSPCLIRTYKNKSLKMLPKTYVISL